MAFEPCVRHHAVVNLEIELQLVAAQRIEALGPVVRTFELAEVARMLAVVDNQLLIQLSQIRHQAKISFTFSTDDASTSISSRVL